jgi:serine/threonine-protein kinase
VPTLRAFVAGRLGEPEAAAIREHLAVCAACRQQVDDLETELMPGSGITSSILSRSLSETSEAPGQQGVERPPAGLDETVELGFLRPSADPRSLGRMGGYEIREVLGQGGMGIVFKAFDESLHRVVAIKVLAPALASSQKARRRFTREARAAAAINHPSIVTIHAVDSEGDLPYLVMEYIAGCSLRQRIKSSPPLSLPEIFRIGVQIADGLAAAHEHGVIHRDIKPANIMLEEGVERVKITDFGLALAALDRSGLTSLGQIVGTPAYMSPEQIAGVPIDARSDLFSLGCVLYAMAAGHSPFQGATSLDVLRKVADLRPEPLQTVDPRIPRDVSALVERLLEKEPEKRPPGAAEVATFLKEQLARVNRAASNSVVELPAVPSPPRPRAERWPWVLESSAGAGGARSHSPRPGYRGEVGRGRFRDDPSRASSRRPRRQGPRR